MSNWPPASRQGYGRREVKPREVLPALQVGPDFVQLKDSDLYQELQIETDWCTDRLVQLLSIIADYDSSSMFILNQIKIAIR